MAEGIIKDAAKDWQSLPDDVKRWLDADLDGAGSGLANIRTWSWAWRCGPTRR
jgi:hypothetical protein